MADKKINAPEVVRSSKPNTLLERHFYFFILCTAVEFIITETWLFRYGKYVCNDDSYIRKQSTIYVNVLVAGAFSINVILNAIRLNSGVIYSSHHNIKTTFYAVMAVNSIAACSALTTFLHPNGTCTNYFGVQLNAEIFPEWLASVPLLGFMAIAVDSKIKFNLNDKIFIGSLFFCILFGFMLVFKIFHNPILSYLLMFLAVFSFGIFMYLAEVMIGEAYKVINDNPLLPSNSFKVHLATRKILLIRFLTVLFPAFPAFYFLNMLKVLDANTTDAALMAMSAISKMVFASLCTDAKLEITHPSAYAQDIKNKLNIDRRIFLRYIFHEIRAPLNSITLGIQYMFDFITEVGANPMNRMGELTNLMTGNNNLMNTMNNFNYNNLEQDIYQPRNNDYDSIPSMGTSNPEVPSLNETLTMMNEATNYMDNVLNDVFAIHKIEEGSLKLIRKPFTMNSLIALASEPLQQMINEKKFRYEVKIDYGIPLCVKGDKYQLSHIISKVLTNAFRFSKKYGKVSLNLSSPRDLYTSTIEDYDPTDQTITELKDVPMRDYVFEIIDSGSGMAPEVVDAIFSPFAKTRPGNLSVDKGTGLGLKVCKEIIEMHGGTLTCHSKLGRGTTFTIMVPLEVLPPSSDDGLELDSNDDLLMSGHHDSVYSQNLSMSDNNSINNNASIFVPSGSFDPRATWNSIHLQQKLHRFSNNRNNYNNNNDLMSQISHRSSSSATKRTNNNNPFNNNNNTSSSDSSSQMQMPTTSFPNEIKIPMSSSSATSSSIPPNYSTTMSSSSSSAGHFTEPIQPAAAVAVSTHEDPPVRKGRSKKVASKLTTDDASGTDANATTETPAKVKAPPKRRRSVKPPTERNETINTDTATVPAPLPVPANVNTAQVNENTVAFASTVDVVSAAGYNSVTSSNIKPSESAIRLTGVMSSQFMSNSSQCQVERTSSSFPRDVLKVMVVDGEFKYILMFQQ